MYLPKFTLESPKSIEEAVVLLGSGEGTKLLSGGTDLFPRMKYKLCSPEVLISLKGLPSATPQIDEDGKLIIDAKMSLTTITLSYEIREKAPLLALAAQKVATREIRNMGTLGGNICQETRCLYLNQTHTFQFTEPCLKRGGKECYFAPKGKKCWATFMSDIAPALFCLDARVIIADSNGEREIKIEDVYTNDSLKPLSLKPDQIITKIIVPETQGLSGSGFAKFTVRETIEFAVVNVGVFLEAEKDLKTCKQVRISVGAIFGGPQRALEAEDWLAGKSLSQENINTVSQKVARSLKIISHHGYSKSYLTECLKTQSRQALNDAVKGLTDQSNKEG
ncbi:FAD binding domain-containing protein [Desulfobacula sp.]|uniref:FAD binding domain-containing protein n=1 Tax=Desulfobacula sp. TaxID=2593537 RepID=UPI002630F211|nr:FAD binding domain-containing protein [Desulfobacula sp.]